MFFDKRNKKIANEQTLYQARPNMVLGCQNAIWGIILIIIIMSIVQPVKKSIYEMQIYAMSFIHYDLTFYFVIAVYTIIFLILIYIIWQLISWYNTTYTITNHRIISKKGVIRTKKNYMPFKSIQDIDLSQNLLEKIVNVGSITLYSAYDNNNLKLANISNPGKVEDILFDYLNSIEYAEEYEEEIPKNINSKRNHRKPNKFHETRQQYDDVNYQKYARKNPKYEYYDEDEIKYSGKRDYNRYEYEEYPNQEKKYHKYDYEKLDDNLEDNLSYAMQDIDNGYKPNSDDLEPYYNDYDYDSMEDFYENNKDDIYIPPEEKPMENDEVESSEKIIRRHFDKFR